MDTFVKKLRGASSNQNLPIYENIIIKDWTKSTQNEQRIDLSNFANTARLGNYEISFDFIIPSDSQYLDSGNIRVTATQAYQSIIYINNNSVIVKCGEQTKFSEEVSFDTLHSISLNTYNNKVILDGVEHTFEYSHANVGIQSFELFTNQDYYNYIYIGRVKFKLGSGTSYRLDMIPAVVNGTSCYKNTLADNSYLYANTGELIAFNL